MDIPNPEFPVYTVIREDGTGPQRTLHRNLLLPINFLPVSTDKTAVPKVKPRKQRHLNQRTSSSSDEQGNSEDSSDPEYYVIPQRRPNYHQDQSLTTVPNIPPVQPVPVQTDRHTSSVHLSNNYTVQSTPSTQSTHSTGMSNSQSTSLSVPAEATPPIGEESVLVLPRPQRDRKPPQRYGEWVTPIITSTSVEKEYFV